MVEEELSAAAEKDSFLVVGFAAGRRALFPSINGPNACASTRASNRRPTAPRCCKWVLGAGRCFPRRRYQPRRGQSWAAWKQDFVKACGAISRLALAL